MSPLQASALPPALATAARDAWEHLLESADAQQRRALQAIADEPQSGAQLARMLACSPFVAGLLRRTPELLLLAHASGELQQAFPPTAFAQQLAALLAAADADLAAVLRRFRNRQMLRILWRDFNRLADTAETVRDTSLLAEACVSLALAHCTRTLEQRFGRPMGKRSGQPQALIVIAMGKLGARELNVSSDIDLIFAYPESGTTEGGAKSLSNEEFFTRVGQSLIAALDAVTAEGFVFRVDMRLRPYGSSGALALNFAALESYYQEQGRDWERYALIKARPITGDRERGEELIQMLRPFVYRRYVDFGVIESLRSMKAMIVAEVERLGLADNVKLGHGGIREVEFIAQCLQLIRGGRDLALQQRELLAVLESCVQLGCLPADDVAELRDAYAFLRDSEHAIQGYADKQTQELPRDPLPRAALAHVMGCEDWAAYRARLGTHRDKVARHFRDLIAVPDELQEQSEAVPVWGAVDADVLRELGYRDPDACIALVADLQDPDRLGGLQVEGRERLERFMPLLLEACADVEHPDLALARLVPLVRAVLRRSAYLVLLTENPPALAELAILCEASPWIAEQVATHPVLLDELLDRSALYRSPDRQRLARELQQEVDRLALDDLEGQMTALRYFKAAHVLRVAASECMGRLELMKVSDKLTFIAEVVLEQVLRVAWTDLARRYGEPAGAGGSSGFVICSYGKLGGLELSYASDLDLVFVFDAPGRGVTDGERSIDNSVFYTRLGQKIIHILEARMAMGQLYEVDMRLRPSGASGLLVSSIAAFASYQRESAWTWEHQALVRARVVAGDPLVAAQVDAVRREVLCRERDPVALAADVVAMRRKMRENLLPAQDDGAHFHIKQGVGGIVDIEFMVQYAVLAWSHRCPELARWSDNIRILETLGRETLLPRETCEALTAAYIALRSVSHQLALQRSPDLIPAAAQAQHREVVCAAWSALFGDA